MYIHAIWLCYRVRYINTIEKYRISPTRVPRVFPLFVLVPGVLVWGGVHRTDGGYISRFVSLNSYWLMNHKYIDIIIKRALLDTTTNTV